MCTQRSQQQIDSTAAILQSWDIAVTKDRLAALEQNVLNLQLPIQEVTNNYNHSQHRSAQEGQP